jgi:hypothetical protein
LAPFWIGVVALSQPFSSQILPIPEVVRKSSLYPPTTTKTINLSQAKRLGG